MRGALSGGVGDLCQQELKAPADSREATAFMSKQRELIANVRFTNMSGKTTAFFINKKVNISEPLKILEFLNLFWNFWKAYSMPV